MNNTKLDPWISIIIHNHEFLFILKKYPCFYLNGIFYLKSMSIDKKT
jgi:hypothetical protein